MASRGYNVAFHTPSTEPLRLAVIDEATAEGRGIVSSVDRTQKAMVDRREHAQPERRKAEQN